SGGAPCVAIINEAFIGRYFGGGAALGKRLIKSEYGPPVQKAPCEIVGIMRDNAWQSLEKQIRPSYAVALQQSNRIRTMLLVNTAGDPKNLITSVRNTIRQLDPKIPVADVQTLNDFFSFGLFPFRLLAIVMGG